MVTVEGSRANGSGVPKAENEMLLFLLAAYLLTKILATASPQSDSDLITY